MSGGNFQRPRAETAPTLGADEIPIISDGTDDAPNLPRGALRVHYTLRADDERAATLQPPSVNTTGITRSDTELHRTSSTPTTQGLRRRGNNNNNNTLRTIEDFEDYEERPGWHPGAEPGVDVSKPDGGHASMPTLQAPCDITVVDFSREDMVVHHLDNETIADFLQTPEPTWSKCRWINVNGLSWDVIQALGRNKGLHKLAIEDLMNTRNRTKTDCDGHRYSNHAYMVLTLQKLIRSEDYNFDSSDSESESDSDHDDKGSSKSRSSNSSRSRHGIIKRTRKLFRRAKAKKSALESNLENGTLEKHGEAPYKVRRETSASNKDLFNSTTPLSKQVKPRTLQRYHASPNSARTLYMERHSGLSSRGLAVAAEQVSIFITNDNTIISFFEMSADDVEAPILTRLQTHDTILRQSCDASMIGQAIIDAIIDLAIPVAACYGDVIGDLELDVLTRPNVGHTKSLYITICEINKLLAFINPILNLINALRDHKTELSLSDGHGSSVQDETLRNPLTGVIITPMTHTYLGDVVDHCVLITEQLEQIKSQAEGLISLIFNTISTFQNESMKQLTIVTIIFLPLTFLTGYFGQNFTPFDDLNKGISHFWKLAGPIIVGTILVLMRDIIYQSAKSAIQHRHIVYLRKNRLRGMRKKRSARR
ncbi:uncharacterized protein E0L32_006521 [Thyridium curvatum]|uniref:Uncharacterized protein n=1 Tax=Thyridium curvatum TaxID=1093900 RepID=A0A507AQF9_9PEZI|nr:uncharacterized protein E0L32_006521 [Thyridium curvatum]TPX13095.1 hypothetical protein E0L32_006521 [Thyridium curvatum]